MYRHTILLSILALVGCSSQDALAPGPTANESRAGPGELAVLTWNVYYGADLDVLLDDEHLLPVRTAQVFGQLLQTDAPARAAAIARRIAADRPHLVGLQEVARYRIQSPGDFLDAAGELLKPYPNADTDLFDFLDLLTAALAWEGAEYVVAARTTTLDAELPMYTREGPCPPCDDLRFTESVAILARSDVAVSNAQEHTFSVNMPVEVSGFELEMVKGWAAVDAHVKGRTYRFVTTHLEPADILPGHAIHDGVHQIQLAQAAELLEALRETDLPIVLSGDLNSEPDGRSTGTYPMLTAAGFVDAWRIGPPRGDGFSANQQADLRNEASGLWHRIDYVMYRDAFTRAGGPFRGSVHARVVGDKLSDRTPGGLWPSDHAGILVVLNTEQRRTP